MAKIVVVTCSDSTLANVGLHCGKTWRLLNCPAVPGEALGGGWGGGGCWHRSAWTTGGGWARLISLLSPPPPHSPLLLLPTEIRTQLVEQFKCLEQQSESRLQLLQDLQEFFRRKAEIELEYSRSLEKLAERFSSKIRSSREHQFK